MLSFLSGLVGAIVGGIVAAVTAVSAAPAIIGGAVIGVVLCVTGTIGVCQSGNGPSGGPPPNAAILSAQTITLTQNGTLTKGQTLGFKGTVKNTGTANYTSGATSRFCIDNSSCATSSSGSFGSPSIPKLAANVISSPLSASWTATSGDHIAYFCLVNGNCVSTSFTVAGGKNDCTVTTTDGTVVVVTNRSSHTFYDTSGVPYGQSCSGSDSSGNAYSQKRTCTTGTLGGSSAYNYASCSSAPAPAQSAVTFSANTTIVRKGESVNLSWDGGNSTSCTVAGTNGFSSSAITGTNVSSGPINAATTFTFTCTLGPSTKSATPINVTLVPNENEI